MESTSLVKALGLLEATAGQPAGRTLAALAAEVGLSKPTAHRILKSLTALGYLQRTATGVYRQTAQIIAWSRASRTVTCRPWPSSYCSSCTSRRKKPSTWACCETVRSSICRCSKASSRYGEWQRPARSIRSTPPAGRAIVSHLPRPKDNRCWTRRSSIGGPCTPRSPREAGADSRSGHATAMPSRRTRTDVGVTCIGARFWKTGPRWPRSAQRSHGTSRSRRRAGHSAKAVRGGGQSRQPPAAAAVEGVAENTITQATLEAIKVTLIRH